MIETSLRSLLQSAEPLRRLSSVEFPMPVAHRISLLCAAIDPHLKQFELRRDDLAKRYGADEVENRQLFEQALARVLSTSVTLEADKPLVPLDPGIRLCASTLYVLSELIDFVNAGQGLATARSPNSATRRELP